MHSHNLEYTDNYILYPYHTLNAMPRRIVNV